MIEANEPNPHWMTLIRWLEEEIEHLESTEYQAFSAKLEQINALFVARFEDDAAPEADAAAAAADAE